MWWKKERRPQGAQGNGDRGHVCGVQEDCRVGADVERCELLDVGEKALL